MARGAGQIRTSRNLKGFRSLAASTGTSQALKEAGRLSYEEERLEGRHRQRRRFLAEWRWHFVRAGGPCRVLPPQARLRLGARCSWNTPKRSCPG
jgi:hypothetical protein